jgi:hypothetical protein
VAWNNVGSLGEKYAKSYTCGYCGNLVASITGLVHQQRQEFRIYVCPYCDDPTYFKHAQQIPGVVPGEEVKAVPENVNRLYREARQCIAAGAFTGSVLLSRKLLMNIAVAQGANGGEPFIKYIEYLAANGYVPPKGNGWVDHIRTKGNEATHEIVAMSKEDAEELISFSEMLLKFIYEFPSRVPSATPKKSG